MYKQISVLLVCFIFCQLGSGQSKYYTKSGKIEFFSNATLEDIHAVSKTALALLDAQTGTIQFFILMKGFEFEKALMQEHFNSDYVESDKFPKSEFKGVIANNELVSYTKDGVYPVKISGQLTIHGVTRVLATTGSIKVDKAAIAVSGFFDILLSDYHIKIPAVVRDKVSKTIKISINCKLEPLRQ
ncbi:MAG: hypothetical protein NVSMB67_30460 [Flavisolibacter sp.]